MVSLMFLHKEGNGFDIPLNLGSYILRVQLWRNDVSIRFALTNLSVADAIA